MQENLVWRKIFVKYKNAQELDREALETNFAYVKLFLLIF